MTSRYQAGDSVHFQGAFGGGSKGIYKIVRPLPVERDAIVRYRIKTPAEVFERIATAEQLSLTSVKD